MTRTLVMTTRLLDSIPDVTTHDCDEAIPPRTVTGGDLLLRLTLHMPLQAPILEVAVEPDSSVSIVYLYDGNKQNTHSSRRFLVICTNYPFMDLDLTDKHFLGTVSNRKGVRFAIFEDHPQAIRTTPYAEQ